MLSRITVIDFVVTNKFNNKTEYKNLVYKSGRLIFI